MSPRFFRVVRLVVALSTLAVVARASAQSNIVAYGVTANGSLFRFDPDVPAFATNIGPLGINPEAIDFRPTTLDGDPNRPLYAIDIGPVTSQLYTVNTTTAAVTPVGAGFPTTVAGVGGYDLSGNQRFGFDFNPTTLAGDGSIRIRLTSTNGVNLRLNSDTGLVAAVDTPLQYAVGDAPFADASAYVNSSKARIPADGTTILFAMDSRSNQTSIQNPPNNGTLNPVGPFGVTINALAPIAFDIWTTPGNLDATIGGDRGLAAFARSDVPWMLYDVNLATGATTGGRLIGGGLDFTGGLALTYAVPEPATLAMGLLAAALPTAFRRRSGN
jgi:hypothetical protein